jgi:hypothetical protein
VIISKFIYRYRPLDCFYTAFHKANVDGVFTLLWFKYLTDSATFEIDLRFLLEAQSLSHPNGSVNYLPKDMFYDFAIFALVECSGEIITLTDVNFTFLQARWALVLASDSDASQNFSTPPSFRLHQCSIFIISYPSTRSTYRITTLECVYHFFCPSRDICTDMPCQLWGDPLPMPSSPIQGYNAPDEETLSPTV